MSSSAQDGAGQSPAPPAFSPLTEPTSATEPIADPIAEPLDPENREPSPEPNVDRDGAAHPPAPTPSSANGFALAQSNGYQPQAPGADNTHMDMDMDQQQHHQLHANPQGTGFADRGIEMLYMNGGSLDYPNSMDMDLYQQQQQQHSTNILMTLARMSAVQQQAQMGMPPTVHPSQVSLPNSLLEANSHQLPNNNVHAVPHVESPLESFARVEFADSVFQMTTYAVIIGRDQRALEQARRDERRAEDYQRRTDQNASQGLPPPSPPRQERGKFSKSYVSEEGGMLGPESDGDESHRPAKRRKMSGNGGSASGESQPLPHQEAAAAELAAQDDKSLIVNRQYVSHTPGAAAVNLSALRPSPYHVPFIGIHSPGPNIASRTKAISREHLKIQFNSKAGVFEAIPLHKNGFFCEDVHYKDEKVVLKSGDRLQIKDVDFIFLINGVPRGKSGAEEYPDEDDMSARRYSEGGKEMSFEFESTHDQERRSTSVEEVQTARFKVAKVPEVVQVAPAAQGPEAIQLAQLAQVARAVREDSESELSDGGDDDDQDDEDDDNEVMETIERDAAEERRGIKPELDPGSLPEFPPMPPKKRGPGRPPKNGIMSKREERLRKKAAMELAKKSMPQPPPGEPPIKRKVGRPRKHPLPEDAPDRPEKRKYKPRKSREEGGDGSDGDRATKERRREKPKTPPLELRREDYSEAALQKPNKNYGVLIDEVLTAAPEGLTLKQIYKRIQMNYPFYYFTVDTKGWESSVRHNLIGNDAFKKNEETHLWSRVPGIDIDAGKKRKATSPDLQQRSVSQQAYGQQFQAPMAPHNNNNMFHSEHSSPPNHYQGAALQSTSYPAAHGQALPNQHPQHHIPPPQAAVATSQPPRPAYPTPAQAPVSAQTHGHGDAAVPRPPPQAGAQPTSYSSPYASKPLPATAAQPGATPHSMARQYAQPQNSPVAANGLSRVSSMSPHVGAQGGAPRTRPLAPAAPSALPLPPAVAPQLIKHVHNFKKTVAPQLEKRSAAWSAIANSAARRGLGLTARCLVPGDEVLEKIVLGVFESSKKTLGANQSLSAGLLQSILEFKGTMMKTLEGKLGGLKSECLILSAIDRVLGFAERSTMTGNEAEMNEYEKAEVVLIPAIKSMLLKHQKAAAAATASATPPAAKPATPVSTPAPPPAFAPTRAPTPTPTPTAMSRPLPAPVAPMAAAPTSTPTPTPAALPKPSPAPVAAMATAPFATNATTAAPVAMTGPALVPTTAP